MSEAPHSDDRLATRLREIMERAIQTAEQLRDEANADRIAAAEIRQQIQALHASWQEDARRQALDLHSQTRAEVTGQLRELVLSRLAQRGRSPSELERIQRMLPAQRDG